jgi:NADPH:quinone reductase-like Zn-dependent oxidoreductase
VKAAVRTRYGPPGVVRIAQVGKPAPGDRELLVTVHATTVNRTDCHYRSGKPWIMRPYTEGPFGAHAEYLVIAENVRVAVMPPNLDYEQAAPGTEGALCAVTHPAGKGRQQPPGGFHQRRLGLRCGVRRGRQLY